MYNITRQEAAEILQISTRSVDRYVKSWKLRAKKEGKIIYIHSEDIASIWGNNQKPQEVIIPNQKEESKTVVESSPVTRNDSIALEKIYADLRAEIQKKDTLIQTLSVQLGEATEIAKNSISLVEYKKSQFLLEESKWYLHKEVARVKEENSKIQEKLTYEKSTNYMLIIFVIILFIALGLLWFIRI